MIVGLIHVLLNVFVIFYIFIIKQNYVFDMIYTIANIITVITWVLFDNKCILLIDYSKIMNNKTSNVNNVNNVNNEDVHIDDLEFLKIYMNESTISLLKTYIVFLSFFKIASMYIAATRSNIVNKYLISIFIFIYYFYLCYYNLFKMEPKKISSIFIGEKNYTQIVEKYKLNKLHEQINPYVKPIAFWFNLLLLFYILYYNKKFFLKYI
jgi:hypothetical protein